MSRGPESKRVIELSGMPGTGKTTMARALADAVPHGLEAGYRQDFRPFLRHVAYLGLMLRYPRKWYQLYRLFRAAMPASVARRRVRRYVKHLCRRRQQIGSPRFGLVIEDEAFATYLARDLQRCAGLSEWTRENVHLLYPRRIRGTAVSYVLVVLSCEEAERKRRLHGRRLRNGPEYAAAEHARYGFHESRRPFVAVVTALLRDHGLVCIAERADTQTALLADPLNAAPD